RLPHEGENPMRIAYAHVFEEPRSLREVAPGVSAGVAAVITRAVSKDPTERFPTALDMREALEAALASPAPSAAAVPPASHAEPTIAMPVVRSETVRPATTREPVAAADPRIARGYRPPVSATEGRRPRGLLLLIPAFLLACLFAAVALRDPLFGVLGGAPLVIRGTATATQGAVAGVVPATPAVEVTPTTPPQLPTNTVPADTQEPDPTTAPVRPDRPAGFRARAVSQDRIQLRWAPASAGVTGYQLQRAVAGGGYELLATMDADATAYSDESGLLPGRRYTYRLRATGEGQASSWVLASAATLPAPIEEPDPTNTPTPSPTPTEEPEPTLAPTATSTPTPTPTDIPEPTDTPRPRPTETPTPEPPDTPTPEPPPPQPPTRTVEAARVTELEDNQFTGGFSSPRFYQGRTARWVYGQRTEYTTMRATFTIEGEPVGAGPDNTAILQLHGMDSENPPKTLIRIQMNGRTIFEGRNPLPNDTVDTRTSNWGTSNLEFDAAVLREGRNTLTITNLEPNGGFRGPPFFMLDRAYVAYLES
ncbi:MAG: fibronectin type III domain-containing protein, partial [Chloroflexota bacterium]|nr:fibronectin type III domain-containing protein [Chloroflexota bacterium]